MALHINLLHEEILEHRQRQRDPLKIGIIVMITVGTLMFGYYMLNAYRTLAIKGQLSAVEREWAKVEPKVTTAQKRSAELNDIIRTTRVLDDYIEHRFYWGPLLEKVARCVAPNTQLTGIEGKLLDDNKGVSVSIEGLAAGREPRAAAEDLRQMLAEQLSKSYSDVKVEFKDLEDLDTIVNLGGTSMAEAHYVLNITFQSDHNAKPSASATPNPRAKQR
jgi:cell division protein FtsL